jgi:hypothetical protein
MTLPAENRESIIHNMDKHQASRARPENIIQFIVTENGRRPWPVAALSDAPGTPREARRPTRGNPEERVK